MWFYDECAEIKQFNPEQVVHCDILLLCDNTGDSYCIDTRSSPVGNHIQSETVHIAVYLYCVILFLVIRMKFIRNKVIELKTLTIGIFPHE